MKLIRGIHNLRSGRASFCRGTVATIGNFDGVHAGHRQIVSQVSQIARQRSLDAAVMVFEPQPLEFFDAAKAPPRLMRFREKLVSFRQLEIDILLCLQFNQRLRALSADAFIQQVLVDGMGVKHLVVGDDFRFGCDRQGDFSLLQRAGLQYGFEVENTPTIEVEGSRVSSSRIREALNRDQFELAGKLLGHSYAITGCVVHGRKLGRQLGVPTANVSLGRKKPALTGVFAVMATTESGAPFQGVANVGTRPTINGIEPALEVHLFGYEGEELYGTHLRVVFEKKLREEMKFDGLEALQAQIKVDQAQAKRFFQARPEHHN